MRQPHLPGEDWDCVDCAAEWPCEPARVSLRGMFGDRPGDLAIFMCQQLAEAAPYLVKDHHPDVLFDRFIAWTARQPLDAVP